MPTHAQAEEQRLRGKGEAVLQQQQQQHRAQVESQERELIELKLKLERLQDQGAKVRGARWTATDYVALLWWYLRDKSFQFNYQRCWPGLCGTGKLCRQ
jgi:hypothetical protein